MTHAFGYGLFYASVGVLLLPQEALHMFADQHAIFLAVMLALAGMSQLISPLAGYYSDRTCSRMGRRVPYILVGNLVLFLCMGAMWLARTNLSLPLRGFVLCATVRKTALSKGASKFLPCRGWDIIMLNEPMITAASAWRVPDL